MPDPAPNTELLRSLGQLVRGLSALFWGLPASLIICIGTVSAGWFTAFNVLPALAATGSLVFGLWQMSHFQKQERPWRHALDRAQLLALVNFGLCPFLYGLNRMPDQPYFNIVAAILALSGILFLFNLNLVLARLGAMLPDETLRQETRQFTALNRGLLVTILLLVVIYAFVARTPAILQRLDSAIGHSWVLMMIAEWLFPLGPWVFMFLVLLPLSLTMAMIWKTKEVIFASVFDTHH